MFVIYLKLNTFSNNENAIANHFEILIGGRVMDSGCFVTSNQNFKKAENVLLVKVQSDLWKRPVHFNIVKTDNFHILYIKCAEEANLSINDFKLRLEAFVINCPFSHFLKMHILKPNGTI